MVSHHVIANVVRDIDSKKKNTLIYLIRNIVLQPERRKVIPLERNRIYF